ncbi:hypothetical protein N9M98_01910 [Candidatus Pseudothioglobus singularis]|nr:hypothetical protein [Candidatus Pseudothioglobus singularis]
MVNDLIDFLKIQSRDIEYYNRYSIALIFIIIVLCEILYTFISTNYQFSISSFFVDLMFTIFSLLFEVLFFLYWLGRKDKKYSYATLLNYLGMLTIITFLALIIYEPIAQSLNPSSWIGIIAAVLILAYILYLTVANLAKATDISKRYALGGSLIIIALLQIPSQILFQILVI